MRLSLDGAGGEAADEEFHREDEEDDEGDGADGVTGHEGAPLLDVFAVEAHEADGDGQEVILAHDDEGEHQFVPASEELHDGSCAVGKKINRSRRTLM